MTLFSNVHERDSQFDYRHRCKRWLFPRKILLLPLNITNVGQDIGESQIEQIKCQSYVRRVFETRVSSRCRHLTRSTALAGLHRVIAETRPPVRVLKN